MGRKNKNARPVDKNDRKDSYIDDPKKNKKKDKRKK
jgi:hypothetical protein